jgi:DNA-binding CsgD family transcriptional regulator
LEYLKPKKKRRSLFGALSFTLIYCWYDVYWRHFEDSPVAASLRSWGFSHEALTALVAVGVVAGVVAALCAPPMKSVLQKHPLKIILHIFAFMPFQMFTLCSDSVSVAMLGLLGGFCIGAVTGRAFYSMFFEIMDIHPAKVVVVGYAIIQTYIHISDIAPLGAIPHLYYLLEAATLIGGLALSCLRSDGEEIERRRVLPENRFHLIGALPIFAMIALIQTCLTLYSSVILPQTAEKPFDDEINIIYSIARLLFLALFGRKLTLVGTLTAFLALFTGGIGSFIILGEGARMAMQFFMEFAYGLLDFLFVWLLATVFYTYGRDQARLKACLIVFFSVRFATIVACDNLLSPTSSVQTTAFFALLSALVTALLIPSAERVMKGMEAQRAYAEGQEGPDVPLPTERPGVLDRCAELMETLPAGISLTEDERAALAYMIDGQDVDVTAHFMNIPHRLVLDLNNSVLKKFGVESTGALLIRLGAALRSKADGWESRETLFDHYGLTGREREIAVMMLSAEPAKNIADSLGVSQSTIMFHSKNLYRKLNIQSRAELFNLFAVSAYERGSPP